MVNASFNSTKRKDSLIITPNEQNQQQDEKSKEVLKNIWDSYERCRPEIEEKRKKNISTIIGYSAPEDQNTFQDHVPKIKLTFEELQTIFNNSTSSQSII